jgi:hypothetical protein
MAKKKLKATRKGRKISKKYEKEYIRHVKAKNKNRRKKK